MGAKQVHTIPVTPAQRWVLLNLSHAETEKLKGAESKAYRRFMRAFGLTQIRETLRRNRDVGVCPAMVNSDEPALFELTEETIEYALRIAEKVERKPGDEDVIGELFDALEDAKADREVATPAGVLAYDAAAESWDPPKEGDGDDDDEAPTNPGGRDDPGPAVPGELDAPASSPRPPEPREDDRARAS